MSALAAPRPSFSRAEPQAGGSAIECRRRCLGTRAEPVAAPYHAARRAMDGAQQHGVRSVDLMDVDLEGLDFVEDVFVNDAYMDEYFRALGAGGSGAPGPLPRAREAAAGAVLQTRAVARYTYARRHCGPCREGWRRPAFKPARTLAGAGEEAGLAFTSGALLPNLSATPAGDDAVAAGDRSAPGTAGGSNHSSGSAHHSLPPQQPVLNVPVFNLPSVDLLETVRCPSRAQDHCARCRPRRVRGPRVRGVVHTDCNVASRFIAAIEAQGQRACKGIRRRAATSALAADGGRAPVLRLRAHGPPWAQVKHEPEETLNPAALSSAPKRTAGSGATRKVTPQRKQNNRKAQQRYREKRKQQAADMEQRVEALSSELEALRALQTRADAVLGENEHLRSQLREQTAEIARLKVRGNQRDRAQALAPSLPCR